MPVLQILFLGPPEVRWGNEVISIQRRIPRALLFYLAARGRMVSRQELFSTFWGNVSVSHSRLRFNESLSRLRTALPDPTIVIADGVLVGLDFERVFIDQQAFENLIDQAGGVPWQIPEHEPLPEHTYHLLQQAIDLWRGSRFLAGDILPSTPELDEWLTRTTTHLEHLRGNVLQRLADHAYAIGDLETALKLARMASEGDELNENLHYRVMLYLVEKGHLNEARQHFNYVQELMRRELDISPSAKLVNLYQRIHQLHQDHTPKTPPKWEVHTSLAAPFVGRRDILLQIRRIFNQHKGVFVLGEAGRGKTRLIQEFASRMHPEPRLLVATCRPLETALPFQPISEVLRRHVTPDEWLTLPAVWASQLTRLFPELETMRPGLEPPNILEDSTQVQATLLEAIRQVFILLNENHHLFFVLDDAHWADEATLSTIAYLLSRSPFDQNASLAVLARQEDLSPQLETMLTSVQQSKHGTVVYLSQLRQKDIADLTRSILQSVPSPKFVANLENGTGGNSLFVLETLRSILESGPQPDLSENTPIPLAESLRKQIRARLQKLSLSTRSILETVAIFGSEFDSKILSAVSQQDDTAVVQSLDDLEHNLVIQAIPSSSGQTRYRFIHDKFREALLMDISPAKAQMLHGRVARVLAKKHLPEQAAILAQHFEAAGEWATAFQYWVDAGKRARQLFSITDASRSFSQAEKLISRVEFELSDEEIYSLYATWSEMAYEVHDTELVRRLGNDLLKLGEKRQSSLLIGTALDTLSDACMTANQFEEGLDFATRAIPYLEQSSNTFEHMEAYIHRGVFLYMLNRFNESIEAFEDALALGTDDITPEVIRARSNVHYQISLLRTLGGWPERGRHHAILSLEDANTSKRTYLRISAYLVLAVASFYLGEYHQAQEYTCTGIDLAQRTQGWRMLGYLNGYAAATNVVLGEIDSALAHANEAIHLGKKYELNDVIALGCCQLGNIYQFLKAPEKAIPYYRRGVEAIGEHFLGIDNLFRLGYALFRTGQQEMGHQTMAFALAACKNSNVGMGIIMIQLYQALAYAEAKEWDQASQLVNHLKGETTWRSTAGLHSTVTYLLGKIALHDGKANSAIKHYKSTIQEARSLGHIWLELIAQKGLVKAIRLAGIDDQAPRERIDEILAQLKANTRDESLQEAFLSFQQLVTQPRAKITGNG